MSDTFTVPETRVYRVGRESRRFQKGAVLPRFEAERLGMLDDQADDAEAVPEETGERMDPGPAENRMGRGPAETRAAKPAKAPKPAKAEAETAPE